MKRISAGQRQFVRYQLPAILWTILIFVLSSIPDLSGPDLGLSWQDKLDHFVFYAIYGFLLYLAVRFQDRYEWLTRAAWRVTVIFGVLYGITDEIHQYFVPGRSMDWRDVLADGLGIIAGATVAFYLLRRRVHRMRHRPFN